METVLRVVFFYLFILVAMRLMGKREFGSLSPFEFVTLLLIPELVQQALVREDFSATNAVVALSTLFLLVFLTSVISFKFPKAEKLIEGEPAVLAHNGRLNVHALSSERITPDEIYAELRKAGFERLSQAKWVLLEDDGKMSIIPRAVPRPTETTALNG